MTRETPVCLILVVQKHSERKGKTWTICISDNSSPSFLRYTTSFHPGSAPFMAPELLPQTDVDNMGPLFTRWSDMYAFGMSAFEVRGCGSVGVLPVTALMPFGQIFTEEVPFKSMGASNMGQIMVRVHRGERPLRSSDTDARMSDAVWWVMQDCWSEERVRRPLAAQVLQRIV
jgi:serine/threonine protein kinase